MFDVEIIMENRPGQLALMGETLGEAGISVEGGGMFLVADAEVNIEILYSDHDGQLILVVDNVEAGRRVADDWSA